MTRWRNGRATNCAAPTHRSSSSCGRPCPTREGSLAMSAGSAHAAGHRKDRLMKPPESLPSELFLLAYDTRKRRLTARAQLGYVVRAAALADLLRGNLVDESGKAQAATPAAQVAARLANRVNGAVRSTQPFEPR